MRFGKFASLPAFRLWALAFLAAFALAACGGGGGSAGSGSEGVGVPPIAGTWNLTVTSAGVTSVPASVSGDEVPTAADVAAMNQASVAQYVALAFPGYAVAVNGSTLTITGTNTNYVLVIDSFSAGNYQDCGSCAVNSVVRFTLNVNYTASGTFQNQDVPPGTGTLVLDVRYVRTA